MSESGEFWTGLPKVQVTIEHVDRALRAMNDECPNVVGSGEVSMKDVMVAAAVLANLDEFENRVGLSFLAMALVHEVLADYVSIWACGKFDLTNPADEKRERRLRVAKAKAEREAKGKAA